VVDPDVALVAGETVVGVDWVEDAGVVVVVALGLPDELHAANTTAEHASTTTVPKPGGRVAAVDDLQAEGSLITDPFGCQTLPGSTP